MRNELIGVKSDEGVYRLAFGQSKPDAPVRILKLPLKAEDRWTVEGKTTGVTFKGTFKVGPEETIKVPAGEFKAFPVSIEDLVAGGVQATSKIYYAKDVGIVSSSSKAARKPRWANSKSILPPANKFVVPAFRRFWPKTA